MSAAITVGEADKVLLRAVEGGLFDELFDIPLVDDWFGDTKNPQRCRRAAEIAEALLGTAPGVVIPEWFAAGGPNGFWQAFRRRGRARGNG